VTNLFGLVSIAQKQFHGHGVGAILARGASGSFGVLLLGSVMTFTSNILLARIMDVTQYGIYIYILTWINLLSIACKLGIDTSLLRFVPAYNAKEEWGLFRGILERSIQYVLITSSIIGVSAFFIVLFLYSRIGYISAVTFWIALILLPLLSLTSLRNATLRALKHVVKASLPASFIRPLIIMLLSSAFYFYSQQQLNAIHVMVFNVSAALIAFTIGTYWLLKTLPNHLYKYSPIYTEKEWLKVSLPLLFMSGMYLVLNQTDIIVIGAFLDAKQVGIYAVATRIVGIVTLGFSAVNTIVAPMISELYSTDKTVQLQKMLTLAARGIFLFTLVASLSIAVFGENILSLFGKEYINGYSSLLILLIGQVISMLSGAVGFLMTMTGHQRQAARILSFGTVFNITLNLFLVPIFGIVGAAISTATTTALLNFLMLSFVWRRLNFNPTIFSRV